MKKLFFEKLKDYNQAFKNKWSYPKDCYADWDKRGGELFTDYTNIGKQG